MESKQLWLNPNPDSVIMENRLDAEWFDLYRRGLSLTKIARLYHVGSSTVRRHLVLGNIPRRDRLTACIEASTKYPKTPFSGDASEEAYLAGFVEDCHVRRQGNQIEVSTTTTHPAMEQLFRGLFQNYSHIRRLAGFDPTHSYYRYMLTTYLDASFEPVLEKGMGLPPCLVRNPSRAGLNSYVGGLVDAEGCVRLNRSRRRADAVFFITIKKYSLLKTLKHLLGGNLYLHERAWRLVFYGKRAVQLLSEINLRHWEKISKRSILQSMTGEPWSRAEEEWSLVVRRIRDEVAEYKVQARNAYVAIHGRTHPKDTKVEE